MSQLGFTFYPKDWWTSDSFFILSPFERYIYLELIFLMYSNDGFVLNNKTMVEGRLRTTIKDEVWRKITDLLVKDGDMLTHQSVNSRLRKTIANRENGKKGGRPKKDTDKPKKPNSETHKNPPLESEIESESENDVVVKENPTPPNAFGYVKNHESLKAELKKQSSWRDMFGKTTGITNLEDRDVWVDRFVEHAIANGKGDFILKVSDAQSYCTNWVRTRINAGDNIRTLGAPKQIIENRWLAGN